ncbi:MAG: hypothetical protein CL928_03790 [Deltaproteobacteria bacterium]|nr:hypothetical protein [Deltaproteobacteria bacterium]
MNCSRALRCSPRPAPLVSLGLWLALLLSFWGCSGAGSNSNGDTDYDGVLDDEDCGPQDRLIYPGADDPYGDGIDQDCDGFDGVDTDADGYPENVELDPEHGAMWDCNDTDPAINPGADDTVGNDVDENCDGADGVDEDGDGYASFESGGNDCDETDYWTNPDATDAVGDAIDQNCDGVDGVDADGDGYASQDTLGTDCDDTDPTNYPGAQDPCDGVDNDCEFDPNEVDEDGDGYFICMGDCDDSDDSVHPGAVEECNDIDQDCDGNIPSTDDDNDGDGWALCSGDCNDNNPAMHPEAEEVCNGQDDDCDGQLPSDEIDADGDGWVGCGADCDDLDNAVYPGQWFETAGDGVDSDCDGSDGAPSLLGASVTFHGTSGANLFGSKVAPAGDVDGDGLADILVAAPGSNTLGGSAYPAGRTLIFTGAQLSIPRIDPLGIEDAYAVLEGEEPRDFSGTSATGVGDVDGDGRDDIVIGAFGNGSPIANAGKVYLVLGSSIAGGGTFDLGDASTSPYMWEGEMQDDSLGKSVAAAGDVDGDNLDDFLIGAPYASPNGTQSGRAYLVLGSSLGSTGLVPASNIAYKFDGEGAGQWAATAVAGAGDVDGDGLSDILIGAPLADGAEPGAGRAYLWKGSQLTSPGTYNLSSASLIFQGTTDSEQLGEVVAFADDLSGDGRSEVMVGTLRSAGGGSAAAGDGRLGLYLSSQLPSSGTVASSAASHTFDGSLPGPTGQATDVDGDGLADLLLGYPELGDGGSARLFLGASLSTAGSYSETDADLSWAGLATTGTAGYSCAGAGDVNGDGKDDLIVGTYQAADSSTAGAAYLLLSSY